MISSIFEPMNKIWPWYDIKTKKICRRSKLWNKLNSYSEIANIDISVVETDEICINIQDKEFIEDELEKSMSTTFRLLDTVDILLLIGEGEIEVYNLMEKLKDHLKNEVDKYEELEGCLFNAVNEEEFIEYLDKRYPKRIRNREIIKNYLYVTKN